MPLVRGSVTWLGHIVIAAHIDSCHEQLLVTAGSAHDAPCKFNCDNVLVILELEA